MRITNRLSTPALALAVAILCACGTGAETGGRSETGGNRPETGGRSVASGGAQQGCLPAADVSSAIGLEVRELRAGTQTYGPNVVCAYQGTDDKLAAFVTTVVGPAEQGEKVFREMREGAKLFLGAAELEAISVGERGYAYGGRSKSEAAAVSGGRLYRAEVGSSASANIGDKKAGMIEAVKKLMGR